MNVEIIGSGSSGNAIFLDREVLIDAGVPLGELGDISKLHTVLLTHIHGDHLNATTIRKLVVNTKAIFLCNRHVGDSLFGWGVPRDRVALVDLGGVIEKSGMMFSPVHLYHDVPNFGWRIVDNYGHRHFHATDTHTLYGISAKYYDSATIECNHHLPTALKLIEEADKNGEFTHLKGAINSHLSVEKAIEFVIRNKIKCFYPCHIGESTKEAVMDCLEAYIKDRLCPAFVSVSHDHTA